MNLSKIERPYEVKLLPLWYIPYVCLLSSCVVAGGEGWYGASVGTDATRMKWNRDGFEAEGMNQSKGLQLVADTVKEMWQNYLLAEGLKYLAGKYYDHQGALVDADTTLKLEELRNAASAAEAEHALEVLKLTHVPTT